ncbi:MAG TPA: nidogen-like domain-containing protein [Candidatus Acidoferrales bacterium]|nr:nidogen-like domain-containing protein [Candidatus Acidoferrales bacterium]
MKRRSVLMITVSMVLLAMAIPGFAAARRNLPGFSTTALPANDDGSTGQISIGFTINLFGTSYSSLYVNNNGNVTFDASLGIFTPFSLTSTATKIIAPFFADVDTRAGNVVTFGTSTVNGRNAFGVEWPGVGYYSVHTDKLNTFELVLIDRSDTGPGNFDFEFNYDSIQWNTGDASSGTGGFGGSPARVGYSNGLTGNANASFELPGSAVDRAFIDGGPNSLIANSLNSGLAGRYVFNVRNGAINNPGPSTVQGVPTMNLPVLAITGILLACIAFYAKFRTA